MGLLDSVLGSVLNAQPGEAPEGGFGNAGDLFGMLGGMLQK